MTTALDLIEAAMSKIGVLGAGETVSAEDADLGLKRLNSLILALESEGVFNYTTTRTTFTLPASTVSRTIGPAQQIAVTAPVKILRGSFTRVGNTDYELVPVTEQEYNLISEKSSFGAIAPAVCFYDGGTPTGNVYFWPSASSAVEVHLLSPAPGGVATSTSTVYYFPPGYQRAIENLLAVEVAPDFDVQVSPAVMSMAVNAKRLLKRTNQKVPQLQIDRIGGYHYSLSDFYGGY